MRPKLRDTNDDDDEATDDGDGSVSVITCPIGGLAQVGWLGHVRPFVSYHY